MKSLPSIRAASIHPGYRRRNGGSELLADCGRKILVQLFVHSISSINRFSDLLITPSKNFLLASLCRAVKAEDAFFFWQGAIILDKPLSAADSIGDRNTLTQVRQQGSVDEIVCALEISKVSSKSEERATRPFLMLRIPWGMAATCTLRSAIFGSGNSALGRKWQHG